MPISFEKQLGRLYTAIVSPPHSKVFWRSETPMILRDLIQKLRELDCHPADIGDALVAIDENWLQHLGGEYRR